MFNAFLFHAVIIYEQCLSFVHVLSFCCSVRHARSRQIIRCTRAMHFLLPICKGFWFLLVFFRVHLVRMLYIKVPIRTICARDESVFHSSCRIAHLCHRYDSPLVRHLNTGLWKSSLGIMRSSLKHPDTLR